MDIYTKLTSRYLFPLHERLKGHDTASILAELENSQWLAPDLIAERQGRALRQLLDHAIRTVPYFRQRLDARITRPDRSLEDLLHELPVTDKPTIRAHFADWRAEGADGLTELRTSGSSGEPLRFLLGRHRISFDIAAKWRATRWWAVDVGSREFVLWGSPVETGAQDLIRTIRDHLLRSRLIPARSLDDEHVDAILDRLRRYRPTMMFGYPSALARIARRALDRGDCADAGVRVAFCTSEVLRPEWRAQIAEAFGCRVANEYGARDAGFIARECPHGRLHITAEEVIVEIVDAEGRAVADGVEGEILVTNLAGPEFPFIRYRTGDRGIRTTERCPCGRGLPVLASICGRANDGLLARNGAWIHGSAVNHMIRDIPGLEAYQVVQESHDRVVLKLAMAQPPAGEVTTRLSVGIERLLGEGVAVEIRQVEQIPPQPNGKFRHIVNRIAETGAPTAEGAAS